MPGLCLATCFPCSWFLDQDEQLRVESTGGRYTLSGPGRHTVCPWNYKSAKVLKAESLGTLDWVKMMDAVSGCERIERGPGQVFMNAYEDVTTRGEGITCSPTEYVLVEDQLNGVWRVEPGPCVWFPGAHETGTKAAAISLSSTEYLIVEERLSGRRRKQKGPCIFFPGPHDRASSVKSAITLKEDEYVKLKDAESGHRWIERGRQALFLEPSWEILDSSVACRDGIKRAWTLKAYEYIRLLDNVTGKVTVHCGEQIVFPQADQELLDGQVLKAIDLKVNEYVKILDQASGEIHVVTGSKQVFLGPYEKVLGDGSKKKAVDIDADHAVLVRDKSTGQLRLETEHRLFFPGPHESIEQVQELINLSEHEAMIIKDLDGVFHYYYGNPDKQEGKELRSFFLPPHSQIVKLCWSRGRRRERRDLFIERLDMRAQYMSFEFNCRTSDNVELVLEGTFFWEVIDLPAMVRTTGDTSGDICNHARSQFIRHVARVTLKTFMDELHEIAKRVWEEDTTFYATRGVKIHSLEVTHYRCADQSTCEILQQIIQETTNRMNRLSQAESENEVKLFQMQQQIQQEKLNSSLLEIQHQHTSGEAEVAGTAEAARVAAFVRGLGDEVPKLEDRLEMWRVLRKRDALAAISEGGASLYYTPSDVDLSIESRAMSIKDGVESHLHQSPARAAWTTPTQD